MQRLIFWFIALLLSTTSFLHTASYSDIATYAQSELPQRGILRNSKGFWYVDVDDSYIHNLTPLLEQHSFVKPPYFSNQRLAGAHISVISKYESKSHQIGSLEEEGTSIAFEVKQAKVVKPDGWDAVDQVFLLEVESKQLDNLREKYLLPPIKHPYHITVAIKHSTKIIN